MVDNYYQTKNLKIVKRSTLLLPNIWCLLFASLFYNCSGQSESKELFSSKDMNEENRKGLYTVFIKLCQNTQAPNQRKSKACGACYGYGQPFDPQNENEAYWVKVEGDKSLLNASDNEFELRKARSAMKAKESEALSAINEFDDTQMAFYIEQNIKSNEYDFDTGTLNLTLTGFKLGMGHTGAVKLRISKEAIETPIARFLISEGKVSQLFNKNGNFKPILKITFGDFFEAKDANSPSSDLHPTAIIKRVEAFNRDSGEKVMDYSF